MFKIVKNRGPGVCVAARCKNLAKRDRFCPKHSKRYQKHVNPYKYKFHQLKYRAIERGKEFTLTLDEFIEFCEETNYMSLKGKSKMAASIDRIDPNKGYQKGNIQIMSLADNTRKMHEDNNGEESPF